MKTVSTLILLFCSFFATSQVPVSSYQTTDLYGEVRLNDGSLLEERIAEIPTKGTYTLYVRIVAENDITGSVSLGSRNIKATNWIVRKGEEVINHTGPLNSIPIRLAQSDTTVVSFEVAEFSKTNPTGIDVLFTPMDIATKNEQLLIVSQSIFLGIFTFLCLFNVIMFFVTKWSIYYKYSLYILAAILYFLYYFGFIQNVFPVVDQLSVNVAYSLYSSIFILYFIFINELGDYRSSVPKAGYYLRVGIIYKTVQMTLEIVLYLTDVNFINLAIYRYTFMVFEIVLMSMIIYYIVKARNLRGRIVIIGSSILIVAAIVAQLDVDFDQMVILESGMLGELLLFSVALGYITKQFYEEKNYNQQLYLEQLKQNERIQADLEKRLEAKVRERTSEILKEKNKVEEKIRENAALLGEVHHRVKNNFQMITNLLDMQHRRLGSSEGQAVLDSAKKRVQSIGLIHEKLYTNDQFGKIFLREYVPDLINMVVGSLANQSQVELAYDIEDIELNVESGIYVGLILNELVTNSIKYGIAESGSFKIQLSIALHNESIVINYHDNGPGLSGKSPQGFGHTIIRTLLEGMSGSITFPTSPKGFNTEIVIRDY